MNSIVCFFDPHAGHHAPFNMNCATTTIDYWATIPTTGEVLRATRGIVITAAANDNQATSTPSAANDNPPSTTAATGTARL
jgi:hypothetical protein